ncbi:hypothetical protein ACFVTP_09015 [Streptomyces celluloflavus]|uniref:hypothetical protein n=1 Tax=Streptomyces celluloflavus TaxID=58344 RepID=UPI0036D77FD3
MSQRLSTTACAAHEPPSPRRLGGGNAVVIVVFLIVAGALAAEGTPTGEVLHLLAGTGLVAVMVVGLAAAGPARPLVAAVRALLAAPQN